MATRSTIAMELADGKVKKVYCHWDGYLSNNGVILRDNYADATALERLLDFGDISSLSDDTDSTVFYKRDRGESGVDCRVYDSVADYEKNAQFEEYNYIWRSGMWFVSFYATEDKFVPLETAFEMQEESEDD